MLASEALDLLTHHPRGQSQPQVVRGMLTNRRLELPHPGRQLRRLGAGLARWLQLLLDVALQLLEFAGHRVGIHALGRDAQCVDAGAITLGQQLLPDRIQRPGHVAVIPIALLHILQLLRGNPARLLGERCQGSLSHLYQGAGLVVLTACFIGLPAQLLQACVGLLLLTKRPAQLHHGCLRRLVFQRRSHPATQLRSLPGEALRLLVHGIELRGQVGKLLGKTMSRLQGVEMGGQCRGVRDRGKPERLAKLSPGRAPLLALRLHGREAGSQILSLFGQIGSRLGQALSLLRLFVKCLKPRLGPGQERRQRRVVRARVGCVGCPGQCATQPFPRRVAPPAQGKVLVPVGVQRHALIAYA